MQDQAISKSGQEPHAAKIADLQVLRGISILLVMLHHFSLPGTLLGKFPVKVNSPFFLGVEIFFVLSGYVVYAALKRDEFHPGRFLLRRFFRLYPPLIALLCLAWLTNWLLEHSTIPSGGTRGVFAFRDGEFVKQSWAVLTGSFVPRSDPAAYSYGAMWSLSVEFQFYATVFVAITVVGSILRAKQSTRSIAIIGTCGVVYVAMLALRFATLYGANVEATAPRWLFYGMTWRFDFLLLGVVLSGLNSWCGEAIASRLKPIGNSLAPWLLMMPIAVMSLCESLSNSVINKPLFIGLGHPLSAVCFGTLVLLAAHNLAFPATRGVVYRTLEWLGDRSYTIYLLHFPIFILAWMAIFYGMPSLFSGAVKYGVAQIVLVTAIGLPICMAAYRWIEVPCIDLGKRACRAMFAAPAIRRGTVTLPTTSRLDSPETKVNAPHQDPLALPSSHPRRANRHLH